MEPQEREAIEPAQRASAMEGDRLSGEGGGLIPTGSRWKVPEAGRLPTGRPVRPLYQPRDGSTDTSAVSRLHSGAKKGALLGRHRQPGPLQGTKAGRPADRGALGSKLERPRPRLEPPGTTRHSSHPP